VKQILVGTASWADPSLVKSGLFYPKSAKSAEDRLRHYARSFPLVEVDSSYYAIPSPQAAGLWNERTPDGFIFNIKAFRLLTQHPTEPRTLPPHLREELADWPKKNVYYKDLADELRTEVWHEFTTALEPLRLNGKLGALLFQFPKWFLPNRANFDHLREIRRRLEKYTVAVEFRSALWFDESHRDKTLAFEREQEFTNVIVDEPQLGMSTIPPVWEVTNESLAMVRMHGRNSESWDKPGLRSASERFNYDYTEQELGEVVPDVRRIAKRAGSTHVIFNVNHQDQGIRGAQMMSRLLDKPSKSTEL
jgi:uncharacterized protein YecE (DUF72 family)